MKYILYCCHKLFFIGVKKTASALILNRYENRKKKVDSDTVGHLSLSYLPYKYFEILNQNLNQLKNRI